MNVVLAELARSVNLFSSSRSDFTRDTLTLVTSYVAVPSDKVSLYKLSGLDKRVISEGLNEYL